MTDPSNSHHLRPEYSLTDDSKTRSPPFPVGSRDPIVPLTNLAAVRTRMDSLQKYLADSVNQNILLPQQEIDRVNSELVSAIHQVIVNGASLLSFSFSQTQTQPEAEPNPAPKAEFEDWEKEDERFEAESEDLEVVEIDAVELLAEHIHLCEICGKGFKRDANLRMHMRAHGNQFKTAEALLKAERTTGDRSVRGGGRRSTRFSCPYVGCNRNKQHKNFRPLKSVICVKNHFKRSHCPKMYSCTRCHKKSFSVLADLKSHLKNCGESKWKCSCGTTFSRKDKLFGHMALFEGHMPALGVFDNGSSNNNNNNNNNNTAIDDNKNSKGLMFEEFGSVDNDDQGLQDVMMMSVGGSSSNSSSNVDWNINMMEDFFNF